MIQLYWAQYLATAASLAIVGAVLLNSTIGKPVAGALLMMGMTPHVIALYFLASLLLFPQHAQFIHLILAFIIMLIIILAMKKYIKRIINPIDWHLSFIFTIVLTFILFIFVIFMMIDIYLLGIYAHDISVYLLEARQLAAGMSSKYLPSFDPGAGQVTLIHPHMPTWTAYLAQALSVQEPARLLPNAFGVVDGDWTARIAVVAAFVCMMLAVLGLGLLFLPPPIAVAGMAIMVCAKAWDFPVLGLSRDPFRSAPLIVLVALIGVTFACPPAYRDSSPTRIGRLGLLAGIALATAAASSAHTINLVYLCSIILAVVVMSGLHLRGQTSFESLRTLSNPLTILFAIGVGIIPAAWHHVRNYVEYGHVLGLGMSYFFYPGTPIQQVFEQDGNWTRQLSLTDIVSAFSTMFGLVETLAVGICGTMMTAVWLRRRQNDSSIGPVGGFSALSLVMVLALPMTLQLGKVSIAGAFLTNARYGATIFALYGPIVVGTIWLLLRPFLGGFVKHAGLLVSTLAVALAAVHTTNWNKLNEGWAIATASTKADVVARAEAAVASGGNWISNDYAISYVSRHLPLYAFSKPTRKLVAAQTEDEVIAEARRLCIKFIAVTHLSSGYGSEAGLQGTVFYRTLSTLDGAVVSRNGPWLTVTLGEHIEKLGKCP